jgi:glycine cleavage system aminomethyltransferase T
MDHRFRAAGATFERRGAWEVPVAVPEEAARLETGAWSLLAIAGPEAPRLLRRLGPVADGAGPRAGVPGRVLRRHDGLWVMTASEFAQHLFDTCTDLCAPLGGGPVGLDALARLTGDPLLAP